MSTTKLAMTGIKYVVQMSYFLILLMPETNQAFQYFTKEFRFDYQRNEEADGWLKHHIIPMTWTEARMLCHAEGAVLASPLNEQLKSAILSIVKNQTNLNEEQAQPQEGETQVEEKKEENEKEQEEGKRGEGQTIFSGVHATYSKGVYTSIEGVPLLRLAVAWAPGEPDNFNNTESCLVMMMDGTMADKRCDSVYPFVCYKKNSFIAVTECGTIDRNYIMDKRTGSCYKLHSKIMSWSEAYKTCEAEGAYLAIINDNIEAEVVKTIQPAWTSRNFESVFPGNYTIGYRDWGHHHNFMTIHGQTLDEAGFQKWKQGKPRNMSRAVTNDWVQICGAVSISQKDGAQLSNIYCNLPFAFLCEMTPNSLR